MKLFGARWASGMVVFEWILSAFGAADAFSATHPTPAGAARLQAVAIELQTISTNAATGLFSNIGIHRSPQQWSIQSLQGDTRLGIAIGSGADVNGDGVNDLLLGLPRHTSHPSAQQAGLAALFLGSSRGLGDSPSWVSESSRPMAHYGAGVAFCDWNGDKLADLAVNVPMMIDPARRVGRIFFYPGSINSFSNSPAAVLQGSLANLYAVSELACAGDVNKDGYQDLLLTAARFTKNFKEEGMAALYLGSKTGLVLTASWLLFGGQSGAYFGGSAAGLGDVNGDGYDDVLIGAPGFGDERSENGRAFLFLGSPTGLQTNASWIMDGTGPFTRFGRSVASAGDVNGDGCQDFLIGAPGGGPDSSLPGTVSLYLGSKGKIGSTPAWQVKGNNPGSSFGCEIAQLGDVDGDRHPDLLIGAANYSGEYTQEGAVFLFRGNGTFFADHPDWILYGGQPEARVGYVLRATGDLNHDGFADFAVGTPFYHLPSSKGRRPELGGRVDVFYGSATGYCKGQIFSADGISSRPRPSITPAPLVAASATAVVPRANHYLYSALGFSMMVTAGGLFWARRAQRLAGLAERARIARDLHDDLGAHLSRLQRESSLADPEITREAILALDRAIWSVNPENDTLENLVSFIGQYAAEFFSGSGIRLRFRAPVVLPSMQLGAEFRKNIFLTVREALNNALKHSAANQVDINIACEPQLLTIRISDDGKGLPSHSLRAGGQGLANMAHRMQTVQSDFKISRSNAGGALVTLKIKL